MIPLHTLIDSEGNITEYGQHTRHLQAAFISMGMIAASNGRDYAGFNSYADMAKACVEAAAAIVIQLARMDSDDAMLTAAAKQATPAPTPPSAAEEEPQA